MKKLTILFVGALVALLSLAPVAGAKGKRHARTVTVCGIVDAYERPADDARARDGRHAAGHDPEHERRRRCRPASSPAPTSAPRRSSSAPRPGRSRRATRQRPTKVLVSVKVRPAATVEAQGRRDARAGSDHGRDARLHLPGRLHAVAEGHRRASSSRPLGSAAFAGGPIVAEERLRASGHQATRRSHGARRRRVGHDRRPRVRPDPRDGDRRRARSRSAASRSSIPAGKVLRPRSPTARSSPPAPRSRTAC